jgi:uncharacterized protein (DUF305 family)
MAQTVEVTPQRLEREPSPASQPTFPTRWGAILLLALVGLLIGAFLLGRSTAIVPPGDDSADAGFARDMSVHHAQAVHMADIMRERSQDPAIRSLAFDIATTQHHQVGQMRGWLDVWGLSPNSAGPAMAWMGHPVAGRMPGMASPAELRELETLPVAAAEAQFLRLMIPHHQAGVDMAEAALSRATSAVVLDLARTIVAGQQAEIDYMQSLLRARGLPPAPVNRAPAGATGGEHTSHDGAMPTPAP